MSFLYPPYLKPLEYYSIPEQKSLLERVKKAKEAGMRVVIASGVFDLLHAAHREYLWRAKQEGDYLVVLIESDVRTRELKGQGRPIWNQDKRKEKILKLGYVDEVLILPPEFKNPLRYEEVTLLLSPDVYATSSNSNAIEHKRKMMEKYGGRLKIVLEEIPDVSTTKILSASQS